MSEDKNLETFYVYRTLNEDDESWGAILGIKAAMSLPNIDFGMTVYAINEKAAISRGRVLYDRVHQRDSDKDNIRRFAASALKVTSKGLQDYTERGVCPDRNQIDIMAMITMEMAVSLNDEYKKHFVKLDNEDGS